MQIISCFNSWLWLVDKTLQNGYTVCVTREHSAKLRRQIGRGKSNAENVNKPSALYFCHLTITVAYCIWLKSSASYSALEKRKTQKYWEKMRARFSTRIAHPGFLFDFLYACCSGLRRLHSARHNERWEHTMAFISCLVVGCVVPDMAVSPPDDGRHTAHVTVFKSNSVFEYHHWLGPRDILTRAFLTPIRRCYVQFWETVQF